MTNGKRKDWSHQVLEPLGNYGLYSLWSPAGGSIHISSYVAHQIETMKNPFVHQGDNAVVAALVEYSHTSSLEISGVLLGPRQKGRLGFAPFQIHNALVNLEG